MGQANTTQAQIVNALDMGKNVAYVVVGTFAIIINILTFAIIFHDKYLFRKSAVITGIGIANLSVSLHIFSTGAFRLANERMLTRSTTAYSCVSMIFPLFYPVSFVSEGVFVFIGGLERLLAINAPMWFHKTWSDRLAWKIVGFTYILVAIFVIAGVSLSSVQPDAIWACGIASVFGRPYILICQLTSAMGGFAGAILTVSALITGVYRFRKLPLLSGDAGRLKKQLQLTKSMSFVSLFDTSLVGIPNILSAITTIAPDIVFPFYIKGSNANFTFCANATAAFIALNIFSPQFRRSAVKLFRIEKLVKLCKARFERTKNQIKPEVEEGP